MKTRNNSAKNVLLILFLILVLFILIGDYLNIPSLLHSHNLVFLRNIINNKELVYFSLSLFIAVLIYYNQNKFSENFASQLNTKIEEFEAFRQEKAEIIQSIQNWLEAPETDFIIFYFPFTILPGFWTDYSMFFKKHILPIIGGMNRDDSTKIVIIGPGINEGNNFNKIIDTIKDHQIEAVLENISNRNKSLGKDNVETVDEMCRLLKDSYVSHFNKLTDEVKERKEFIKLVTPENPEYWRGKPTFSFVYRKLKEKKAKNGSYKPESNFLIIDTFDIVNNLSSVRHHFSNNGLITKKTIEENLLKDPNFYVIKHNKVSNLFISNILHTSFGTDDSLDKEILNFIIKTEE